MYMINVNIPHSLATYLIFSTELSQYGRPRVLAFEPVDGVLVVLSSNIDRFVHQWGDVCQRGQY